MNQNLINVINTIKIHARAADRASLIGDAGGASAELVRASWALGVEAGRLSALMGVKFNESEEYKKIQAALHLIESSGVRAFARIATIRSQIENSVIEQNESYSNDANTTYYDGLEYGTVNQNNSFNSSNNGWQEPSVAKVVWPDQNGSLNQSDDRLGGFYANNSEFAERRKNK